MFNYALNNDFRRLGGHRKSYIAKNKYYLGFISLFLYFYYELFLLEYNVRGYA